MSERTSVIVTGGSSGIGLATAKLYAARGCDVAIVGRSAEKLAAAAAELRSIATAAGQRIETRQADLCDFEQAQAAIDSLVADGFGPDILVNSAGVIVPGRVRDDAARELRGQPRRAATGAWSTRAAPPCRTCSRAGAATSST